MELILYHIFIIQFKYHNLNIGLSKGRVPLIMNYFDNIDNEFLNKHKKS
jgi:hypothetical protein